MPSPAYRVHALIEGTVQGVGFRPYVYRLASALRLGGWVRNDGGGVRVEVEGAAADVQAFLDRIVRESPALADVASVTADAVPARGERRFTIAASDAAGAAPAIAADAATCAACLGELFDPHDRRHRYPFITCTACGPRFTIARAVPYDRARTTMAAFAMCAACRAEYDDPADRRFHAETNACPACGPRVALVGADGGAIAVPDALSGDARALRDGAIVAVKGLGGFHLACRADDAGVIARLRARKRRAAKPFALMVPDVAAARTLVRLDRAAAAALESGARPIVLAPRRPDAPVAAAVAPRQADLGVLLPYTPLHHLLLAELRQPIVLTSGNVTDEPIAHENADALARLGGIADLFLVHDRGIAVRTDDSVVRMATVAGTRRALPIRRARGWTPLPVALPVATPAPILAVGGELKSTCAVARGGRAWLTQHLGDLGDATAYRAFREALDHFQRLFDVVPAAVAHDLHPGYRSTRFAATLGDLVRVAVQHHHAHVASCLADNGIDRRVLGVAWDGTGHGPDGTVWGGEFLLADLGAYTRVGRFEAVPLPGGDAAVREPWRMAAAFLGAAYGAEATSLGIDAVRRIDPAAWRVVAQAAAHGLNAPRTSSAGRLFDAVACLVGLRDRVGFEAQGAMELEALAAPEADRVYAVAVDAGVVRTTDVVRGVVEDLLAAVAPATIAARFHATLAGVIVRVAERVRTETGIAEVALSGGVFQNVRLLEAATAGLAARGFGVLVHRRVPPNDGGLALGQAAVAARRLADGGAG